MKKIIITLICLFPLAGIAQDKFEISGTLSTVGTGRTVLLQYKDSEGKDAKDSTIIRNGKFKLSGTTAFGNRAALLLLPVNKDPRKRWTDSQIFFLEKGKYQLSGTDSIAKALLTGTQSQKEYLEYQHRDKYYDLLTAPLSQKYSEAGRAKEDSVELKKLRIELNAVAARRHAMRDSFIFKHPDSYVTLYIVSENNYEIEGNNLKYYEALSKRVLASFFGQELTKKVESAKLMAIGKTIDFTQPDDKGKEFKLSSLKGKYVLVDFWASWCGPCRGETPYLIRAYQTLKNKNFEIVSVDMDNTKAAWLKAVAEDKMTWIQVGDLKGVKNEVASRLGITSIPRNLLLDPNGVIIAKNLLGEGVTEQISALIK